MSEVIKKCQYAGDPNDEYCRTCNGVTMLVDGQEISCTECTAYTPVDCKADEPMNPPIDDDNSVNMTEGTEDLITAQAEEEDVADTESTNSTQNDAEEACDEPEAACDDITVVETESDTTEDVLPDGVTVKSIRYMSGMTVQKNEKNGSVTYYKFTAEEEWTVNEEVGSDMEKMQNVREKLWAKVNLEVDTQVGEVFANE